jgi:hypothetical protein
MRWRGELALAPYPKLGSSHLPAATDGHFVEPLANTRVSLFVALNHERRHRLGCLVRVTGIEGRRRVVLNSKLNSLRDLGPSQFGHDAESEVNS